MIANINQPLVKPNVYETKRIQLTSPILHIGSEVSRLDPFEYVQTGNRVYFPDSKALAKAFYQAGKLQDYISAIENRQDLTLLLKSVFGEDWKNQKDTDENPIFPENAISRKWTQEKITDVRPMIRNGMGQLYIPGTSIKGAIRTAIAYHLIKHHAPENQRISAIEKQLQERMEELKRKPKKVDDQLFMNSLFSDFDLFYQNQQVRGKVSGANTDFMRAIHVTDTEPLLEKSIKTKQGKTKLLNLSVVAEVAILSHFNDNRAKYKAPIFVEMSRDVKTQFTLTLDHTLLSWFRHRQGMQIPFQTIDQLLEICEEFSQEQWDAEYDYWYGLKNNNQAKDINNQTLNLDLESIREFYESEKCPYQLRVGWSTGMNGTTINLLFDDDLRAEIRDTFCPKRAPGYQAPKSRRVVMSPHRELKYLPGWVKFKVL